MNFYHKYCKKSKILLHYKYLKALITAEYKKRNQRQTSKKNYLGHPPVGPESPQLTNLGINMESKLKYQIVSHCSENTFKTELFHFQRSEIIHNFIIKQSDEMCTTS